MNMRNALLISGLLLLPGAALAQVGPSPTAGGEYRGPEQPRAAVPDTQTAITLDEIRARNATLGQKKRVKKDVARPATVQEVVAGKQVFDTAGQPIALIEKIEADGAVLRSGLSAVKVPLDGFGVNKTGLLLNMTKAQFEALVASVSTTPRT